MITVIVILISLAFGSFANNVISHYSAGMPLDVVRSKCQCGKKNLSAKDLIPLVSFLLLKGECRYCDEKILLRYPLIEVLVLTAGLLCYWIYGITAISLINFIIIYVLLLIGIIDLYSFKIPNTLSFLLLLIGIAEIILTDDISWMSILYPLILGSVFIMIYLFFKYYKGIEVIGIGDIKLLTVITLIFGLPVSLLGIWFSSMIGLAVFLFIRKPQMAARTYKIPFGFYLSLSFIVMIYFGDSLIEYYIKIISGSYV